jgi:hypothetical protein
VFSSSQPEREGKPLVSIDARQLVRHPVNGVWQSPLRKLIPEPSSAQLASLASDAD